MMANEIPSMHVPTRPDTAAHTAALLVSMRMPFREESIRVIFVKSGDAAVFDKGGPGPTRPAKTRVLFRLRPLTCHDARPAHSPPYDVLPMSWRPQPE